MNQIRAVSVDLLMRIERERAYANILLGKLAQDKRLDAESYPVVQRLVRGVLENRTHIDSRLEKLLKGGIASLPDLVRTAFQVAVYQLLYLDRAPAPMVVDESVEFLRAKGFAGMTGVMNAVLRKIAAEAEDKKIVEAEPATVAEIAERYSHPLWMVERWERQFGFEETRKLCAANNQQWPVCVRVNTLRASPEKLLSDLAAQGVQVEPAGAAVDCLLIREMPKRLRLQELQAWQDGLFFVQDQSSALVCSVADAQPGERVIDLCSAPGGKTCHLALSMRNQGVLSAVDVNKVKIQLVEEACARLGISCVEFHIADGRKFSAPVADLVLLDAPCSGLGVVGRRADLRWNKKEEEIAQLLPKQAALLEQAALLVKPGGRLIYSTCSIENSENEEQVESFLQAHTEFQREALPGFIEKSFHGPAGDLRSWPQRHAMAGAFACRLRRVN